MNIANSIYNPHLSAMPLQQEQNNSLKETNIDLDDSALSSNTQISKPIELEIEPTQDIRTSMFDLRDKNPNRFLHSFNQEKIDKMVQEYKAKLQIQHSANPDIFMDVEYLTRQFKKGLQEKLVEINSETSSSVKNFSQLKAALSPKY